MGSLEAFCCGCVVCNNAAAACCGGEEQDVQSLEMELAALSERDLSWARHPSQLGPQRQAGREEVILLMESATKSEALAFQIVVLSTTVLLEAYLIVLLVLKLQGSDAKSIVSQQHTWGIVEIAIIGVFLLALFYCVLHLFLRVRWIRRENKRSWTRLKWLLIVDASMMLGLQALQLIMTLTPLSLTMADPCNWFKTNVNWMSFFREAALFLMIAWMCYTARSMTVVKHRGRPTTSPPMLLYEASWQQQVWSNAPLIVWITLILVFSLTRLILKIVSGKNGDIQNACHAGLDFQCSLTPQQSAVVIVESVFSLGFSFIYGYTVWQALHDQRKLPYARYRLPLLYTKLHVRQGLFIIVLVQGLSSILQLVEVSSCWSYVTIQIGTIASVVAFSLLAVIFAVMLTPRKRDLVHAMEEWAREVGWTEPERDEIIAQRLAELTNTGLLEENNAVPEFLPTFAIAGVAGLAAATGAAPSQSDVMGTAHAGASSVFCMEMAIKAFYFCRLAYRWQTALPVSMEHALELFPGLAHAELFEETKTDSRAVLCWGPGCVVVSFRGTATRKNVVTDLKFWRTPHQPRRRGPGLTASTVMVHTGFYRALTVGGFGERVLNRVREVAEGHPTPDGSPPRILLTGHSLGGAMALLAAMDLARAAPQLTARLSVYTMGAPKPGNASFAAELHQRVPDVWAVVNDQDPIPRVPGLFYSCAGTVVRLNARGDLILKPSEFEVLSINRSGGMAGHHLLGAYALSFYAVLRAQIDDVRGMQGGLEGVMAMCGRLDVLETLTLRTVDAAEVDDEEHTPKSPAETQVMARDGVELVTQPGDKARRVATDTDALQEVAEEETNGVLPLSSAAEP